MLLLYKAGECQFERENIGGVVVGLVDVIRTENCLQEAVATIGPISAGVFRSKRFQVLWHVVPVRVSVYMCVCMCVSVCVYMRVSVCMRACVCATLHARECVCMHAMVRASVKLHVCVCVCVVALHE